MNELKCMILHQHKYIDPDLLLYPHKKRYLSNHKFHLPQLRFCIYDGINFIEMEFTQCLVFLSVNFSPINT
ncbi:hypothetical protein BH11BAC4_BH11BAC4_03900 [soil metagenome]